MSMETHEEARAETTTDSSGTIDNDYSHVIAKGRRSKRPRLHRCSPVPGAAATTSTSSSGETSVGVGEEEEDMANCLILLAQGRALDAGQKSSGPPLEVDGDGEGEKFRSRGLADQGVTTTHGKVGLYVYECKTCNKCFPSFQALGGHRSSHKKLRTATVAAAMASAAAEEKKSTREDEGSLRIGISIASYPNSGILPKNSDSNNATPALHAAATNDNVIRGNKLKMHECSICGSEFSSGQALGGHMRRHRVAATTVPEHQGVKKQEKSIMSLDLNLPAPADDEREELPGELSLGLSGEPPLVFSASALVDCHY